MAGKAYMVRDGVFKDVDAVLFTHVGDKPRHHLGQARGHGPVSRWNTPSMGPASARGRASPGSGRSALDAVSLMNIGWEFKREHLRPEQRSHYVITDGGDQPNVVPQTASVWYYFREQDFKRIADLYATGNRMADGAAMMTGTTVAPPRPGRRGRRANFNKPIAEAANVNIQAFGLPKWTADEQAFAKAVQTINKAEETKGLGRRTEEVRAARGGTEERRVGRHRRRLLDRADHHGELSVEHSRPAGPRLAERHRHGHADRP